jgi:hypothetical protein
MARTQDKKTAHWSSKGASIERAEKGWRKNEQKMREIDREEQIYGTRENSTSRKTDLLDLFIRMSYFDHNSKIETKRNE